MNGTPESYSNNLYPAAPDDIDKNGWMRHTYWYKVIRNGQDDSFLMLSNDGINYNNIIDPP